MIGCHRLVGGRLERREIAEAADDPLWIDLCDPSREEELEVERILGFQVPTRQEMAEIEESARLYTEGGALVMTAVVLDGVAEGRPKRTEVTFLLTRERLVTVRYSNPMPFRTFDARVAKQPEDNGSAQAVFVSLLESFVERIADVLEIVAGDLNRIADTVFYEEEDAADGTPGAKTDLQALIRLLGRKNSMLAVLRESLLSFGRIVPFVRQGASEWVKNGPSVRLKAVERDIKSLAAFETQLEQQISFLHEATLGLINIEQNAIIKVFSIAAVLFLPPTLVGTVYGMNFNFMPELSWKFGYPFAIATMVLSAFVPYWWFKRRGWL
ncbi:magnesium transporter CorA family protein [Oharaeibacter diazotrophicus]|uniref:Magnesium transport protein CorA n=1 Tax=Oharaeibacter diazotrophicus TaxID=1920512 RepID=A0A4R6RI92_9HYPH|nr:magnesium transporter CorA family protein [Oharaeibacter diazotrophicus]TDP85577.1 magnesium transporter [Oharaeibacter diazotrophicus]BBE74548.1 magnesium transport protein CorA [Pleomorphomonas sp. SM30]GLS75753.1 magnesium/cobalt transporter [Oharaeibacter diazotrophicus]